MPTRRTRSASGSCVRRSRLGAAAVLVLLSGCSSRVPRRRLERRRRCQHGGPRGRRRASARADGAAPTTRAAARRQRRRRRRHDRGRDAAGDLHRQRPAPLRRRRAGDLRRPQGGRRVTAARSPRTTPRPTTDGGALRSRMVLRIPTADFDEAMDRAREGRRRWSPRSDESADVTTQVLDIDVRVEAQQRSIDRIQVLFDNATSIKDVVSIEARALPPAGRPRLARGAAALPRRPDLDVDDHRRRRADRRAREARAEGRRRHRLPGRSRRRLARPAGFLVGAVHGRRRAAALAGPGAWCWRSPAGRWPRRLRRRRPTAATPERRPSLRGCPTPRTSGSPSSSTPTTPPRSTPRRCSRRSRSTASPTVRRAYGDWTDSHLSGWMKKVRGLALQPMLQVAHTSGQELHRLGADHRRDGPALLRQRRRLRARLQRQRLHLAGHPAAGLGQDRLRPRAAQDPAVAAPRGRPVHLPRGPRRRPGRRADRERAAPTPGARRRAGCPTCGACSSGPSPAPRTTTAGPRSPRSPTT